MRQRIPQVTWSASASVGRGARRTKQSFASMVTFPFGVDRFPSLWVLTHCTTMRPFAELPAHIETLQNGPGKQVPASQPTSKAMEDDPILLLSRPGLVVFVQYCTDDKVALPLVRIRPYDLSTRHSSQSWPREKVVGCDMQEFCTQDCSLNLSHTPGWTNGECRRLVSNASSLGDRT